MNIIVLSFCLLPVCLSIFIFIFIIRIIIMSIVNNLIVMMKNKLTKLVY